MNEILAYICTLRQQPISQPYIQDNLGKPVPEKNLITPYHYGYYSISLLNFTMVHSIVLV